LVHRGHRLQDLLHEYPIDLVINLHRAALENQRLELQAQVLGFSAAVNNALDNAFNTGKGRLLENWLKLLDSPPEPAKEVPRSRPALSPGAMAFFQSLPRTRKD